LIPPLPMRIWSLPSPAPCRVSSSASRIDDDYWRGWVFLMTRGHSVEAGIGRAIAAGQREQRARPPDRDARVLLRWTDKPFEF
jgi:hypothetical protein